MACTTSNNAMFLTPCIMRFMSHNCRLRLTISAIMEADIKDRGIYFWKDSYFV